MCVCVCVCVCVFLSIVLYESRVITIISIGVFTQPFHSLYITRSQFLSQSLTSFNSDFSFSKTRCHTKVKEPSLPNYLLIAGRRIVGCISFQSYFALS